MSDQIITPEGYEKLKNELELLTTARRREIADRIERAKDMGDLSENAEYNEAKDAQAFNEGRIADITSMIKNVTVVQNGNHKDTAGLGSTVTVETDGQNRTYTIVSFNEADPGTGKISNESPLGRSFVGRKKGDTVEVETPRGVGKYKILKVE